MMKRIRWSNGEPHECLGDEAVRWDAEFNVCRAVIEIISRNFREEVPVSNYEPSRPVFNPEGYRLHAHIPTLGRFYRDQNGIEVPRRLGEVYFYGDVWENPICLVHAVEEPYENHLYKVFSVTNRPLEAIAIEASPDRPEALTPYDQFHLGINLWTLLVLETASLPIEEKLQRKNGVNFERDAHDEEFGETTNFYRLPDGRVIAGKKAFQDPAFQKTLEERGSVHIEKAVTEHPIRDPVLRYERKILQRLYEQIPKEKERIQRVLGWRGKKTLREIIEAIDKEKRDIDFYLNHNIGDFL